MHIVHWFTIADYSGCAVIGFLLRYVQDRKVTPRPDPLFQLVASMALSFVAYISYSFYKISFTPPELWIGGLSWMGSFIVFSADNIARHGILTYMRKIAEDFLTYTKKREK